MIIFIAGNTPDRYNEEKELLRLNLMNSRLLSYYFLDVDATMHRILKLWGLKSGSKKKQKES